MSVRLYGPINMSNLKILTFLAFTFIASGIVSGDFFSGELVIVVEGGLYRLTIDNFTLVHVEGRGLILSNSTFVTRPYCSICGATYNELLFDNWYFLPGVNGTILGLKSTQFNNLTSTSWKLGDCEPLALGVHNASKMLYISCATNNDTVSLRVVDYVRGGEPGIVTFKMNSSVSNEYTESSPENPGIFVEYNKSYHFVSSVGNDLLIHKLDGFLAKHFRTYRAPCSSSISDIAILKDNASLVTRCRNGDIYIFNLYSAYFTPINSSLSTEPDYKVQYEILVSYSGSYVAIWSSEEITVLASSSWILATISNHENSITSLTFVESKGSVLIVYTVADFGVYTYNITGALIHGIETVSIMIPGSKSVCSVDGCLGITSVGSLAVVANINGGLLFYSFSSTSVTTYGPYFTGYIARVVPNLLSFIDGYNSSTTGTKVTTMPPPSVLFSAIELAVLLPFVVILFVSIICLVVGSFLMVSRKKGKSELEMSYHYDRDGESNVALLHFDDCLNQPDVCLSHSEECLTHPHLCLPHFEEVGDVLKQAGCFVLGEIQTITIPETGGEWNLYPFPNNKRETCAMLSAPPGVVPSGKTVVIMYGVIPSGPFVFPDGLELASVLIYLDCNDKEKLQKPLSLSLKHCVAGRDDDELQKLLCFVKASHTPQNGRFVFKSQSTAVFDRESGTLQFNTHFCLNGICVKEACKEIEDISTRCYAIPCMIQSRPTSRVSYEYRICLLFGLPSWENVFEKHYCTPREYSREKDLHEVVRFKADEPIQSFVNESDMKGSGWQMMKLRDSVAFTDLETALSDMCEMKCEQIIHELNRGLIFPHVKYVITYEREPKTGTHGNRTVCLTLRGCKPKDTCFSIRVREELRRERTPECDEDGHHEGPSQAVQPQSPIGGFVLPQTFGNGFLDWTPSDAGLLGVVDKIKLGWQKIAIYLGLPLTDVVAFKSDQELGGLRALQQWRDGREGCETPSTWKTLLTVVKDKLGANVHADLEREVMIYDHWSIRKEAIDIRDLVAETIC